MSSRRKKKSKKNDANFSYNEFFVGDIKENFIKNTGSYLKDRDMFGSYDHELPVKSNMETEAIETAETEVIRSDEVEVMEIAEAEVIESDIYAIAEASAVNHYIQMSKAKCRKELEGLIGELDPDKQEEAVQAKNALAKKYKDKKIDLFFLEELFLSNYTMVFMCGRYYIYNGMAYELLTEYTFFLCCKELLIAVGKNYLTRRGLLKDAYLFTLVRREDKNEIMISQNKKSAEVLEAESEEIILYRKKEPVHLSLR